MFDLSYIITEGNVIKLMASMKNYYKIMTICTDKVLYTGLKITLHITISLENAAKLLARQEKVRSFKVHMAYLRVHSVANFS